MKIKDKRRLYHYILSHPNATVFFCADGNWIDKENNIPEGYDVSNKIVEGIELSSKGFLNETHTQLRERVKVVEKEINMILAFARIFEIVK